MVAKSCQKLCTTVAKIGIKNTPTAEAMGVACGPKGLEYHRVINYSSQSAAIANRQAKMPSPMPIASIYSLSTCLPSSLMTGVKTAITSATISERVPGSSDT